MHIPTAAGAALAGGQTFFASDRLRNMPSKLKGGQDVEAPLPCVYHGNVGDALHAKASHASAEDAFFVADLGEVYRQYAQWTAHLPRVQPFFAVKCNPDPLVIKLLARLGAGFDCASKSEIMQVLHEEGIGAHNIIYAHPCKPASHLRFAQTVGVSMMTFDNADELVKISQLYPEAKAVLRILTDDSQSLCQLGLKFGAAPGDVPSLLATAQQLGIDVVGVSFHVGSGCQSESAFADAVLRARRVFDQATQFGFRLSLLDVGGGFPGRGDQSGLSFGAVADVLRTALATHFPVDAFRHLRIIAEPGRYFVASAFSLAVNVIARRKIERDKGWGFRYYVNDGVYGSFNCIMFDHQQPQPRVLMSSGRLVTEQDSVEPLYESSVWGPTCDSIDCIVPSGLLPELQTGDWLVFDGMGAYTICAASRFNGFKISDIVYVDTEGALLRR